MKIHKSLRIDEDVVKWLQSQAKEQGRSFNNYVGTLLRKEKDNSQVVFKIDEKGFQEQISRHARKSWK